MSNKISGLLTTIEAAKALRIHPCTLRKWSSCGGPIEPVRIHAKGGRLLWRRSDIEGLTGIEITDGDLGIDKDVE
jgi:hypothetical protein